MKNSAKVLAVFAVLALLGFGYSQYAFASQIGVSINKSELQNKNDLEAVYNVELIFENPSMLYLTAGETEFLITADGEKIGYGKLSPFLLPALSTTIVEGTFQTNKQEKSEQEHEVKITGVTKYDLFVTSIDVPFVFYPTEEQAREFIHQS